MLVKRYASMGYRGGKELAKLDTYGLRKRRL